jgi:hypothetical protein
VTFIGPYAVVGLSEPRGNRTFAGLPLQGRLGAEKVRAALRHLRHRYHERQCRSLAADRGSFTKVLALPKIRRPSMIDSRATKSAGLFRSMNDGWAPRATRFIHRQLARI